MQRVISIKVLNEFLQGDNVVVGAAGSDRATVLELDFRGSDVWAGTSRYIVFTDAHGEAMEPILLGLSMMEDGDPDVYLVPVPLQATRYAGEMTVTMVGYVVEDEKRIMRITTEAATFRVMQNDYAGIGSIDVDATALERLQSDIDLLKDLVHGHWMFVEIGEDGYLYELRTDAFPVQFALSDAGILEVGFRDN